MKIKPKALITGITGQDGSYLAEFLLSKGYEVHGIVRYSSSENTRRIKHILDGIIIHYGDVTDYNRINFIIGKVNPDEVYNLAAQSHVGTSFKLPVYTFQVNAQGTLNLLNAIRENTCSGGKITKFYQASTSELYGNSDDICQNESRNFYPKNPYACAKLFSYWITVNYRESYGMYACNGVLFNHESPRRGEKFVTRKITKAIKEMKQNWGKHTSLKLGNIYTYRDWGYAPEYVEAMWQILQQDKPEDFVIATGETHTIKEFITEAFTVAGYDVFWQGEGLNEKLFDKDIDIPLVEIDSELFRPCETKFLKGDYTKANKVFGFEPKVTFKELVKIMVEGE
jgi:GDPmannose 4,6-dehydratase